MDPAAASQLDKARRLSYICSNSKFKILSHEGGYSGIQVVASLSYDAMNPAWPHYQKTWSNYNAHMWRNPMQNFLFKFIRYSSHKGEIAIPGIRPRAFEIQTPDEIRDEALAQHTVFVQSLQQDEGAMEPVCPMVLAYANGMHPETDNQRKLREVILANLVPRGERTLADEQNIINLFLGAQYGFILQEFIAPSDTLYSFEQRIPPLTAPYATYDNFFGPLALYELIRLNMLGYDHNDFHGNNALVNTAYNYLNDGKLGRVFIIDFGRLKRPTNSITGQVIQIRTIHEGIDYLRQSTTLNNNPRLNAVLHRPDIAQMLTDIAAIRHAVAGQLTAFLTSINDARSQPGVPLHARMGGGNKINGKFIKKLINSIFMQPREIDFSKININTPNRNKKSLNKKNASKNKHARRRRQTRHGSRRR